MMIIRLTNSEEIAVIDDEDYNEISYFKWFLSQNGYAVCTSIQNLSMHRCILSAKSGMEIDHINRNKLDNRRCNLRVVTHKQNQSNRGMWAGSGEKYVYWKYKEQGYRVQMPIDGKQKTLGFFKKKEDAVACRDRYLFLPFNKKLEA